MTRDEAIKRLYSRSGYVGLDSGAAPLVDALIALDILKVDDPHNMTVYERLQRIMTELAHNPKNSTGEHHVGYLTQYGAGCILSGLEAVGLEIVRK